MIVIFAAESFLELVEMSRSSLVAVYAHDGLNCTDPKSRVLLSWWHGKIRPESRIATARKGRRSALVPRPQRRPYHDHRCRPQHSFFSYHSSLVCCLCMSQPKKLSKMQVIGLFASPVIDEPCIVVDVLCMAARIARSLVDYSQDAVGTMASVYPQDHEELAGSFESYHHQLSWHLKSHECYTPQASHFRYRSIMQGQFHSYYHF